MAQQTKSTHRGHCQACGRLQALVAHTGLVAKHGYTVKGWGYFHGTCTGSDRLPLQRERKLTDEQCLRVTEYGDRMQKQVARLLLGDITPANCTGAYDPVKREYARIPWADATHLQRHHAVRKAVYDAESEVRHARAYVEKMRNLAAEVCGTEPLPIQKVERVVPVAPTVDVTAGTVTGVYATKAARQADLDKLGRRYEKARQVLQDLYLRSSEATRKDKQAIELYYGVYSLAHWRPKHSELALKLYGDSARVVVQEIEELVRARQAVKTA